MLSVIACTRPAGGGKLDIHVDQSVCTVSMAEQRLSVPYSVRREDGTCADMTVGASVDASWLKVGNVSASEVLLLISSNISGTDRSARLTLSCQGASDLVCHVVQSASGSYVIEPVGQYVYADAQEGDAELAYTIKGAASDQSVSAGVPLGCEWLSVKSTTDGKVVFHLTFNDGAERAQTVRLSFPGASDVDITVVQKQFVATSVIKLTTACVVEKCTAHSFDVDYSITGERAGSVVCAEPAGSYSWLKINSVSDKKISFTLEQNSASDDRTAEVRLSCSGARDVLLTVVQAADNPFFISLSQLLQESVDVTVTPSDPTATYAYSVETVELFNKYGPAAYIAAYRKSLQEMAAEEGVPFEALLTKGETSFTVDKLTDDTDYYALAFDIAADGTTSGKVTLLKFHTPKAEPSDNRISFSVDSKGIVSVSTTNNDPYIFDVWDYESWAEIPDHMELAKKLVAYMKGFEGALEMYTHRGNYRENYTEWLTPGKNVAFAFGYKNGITTEVFFYEFDWTPKQ